MPDQESARQNRPRVTVSDVSDVSDVAGVAAGLAVRDEGVEFCRAVSLLAAIEGAVGQSGHEEALPFLGMARAELVEFGLRQPAQLIDLSVVDIPTGLRELHDRLTALIGASTRLERSLRLDAAREQVRRGM